MHAAPKWLAAGLSLALVTIVLVRFQTSLERVQIALAYLLVCLAASSAGGRRLGVCVAVAAFLAFNYFFIPPYHTLVIANRLDWFVLFAFLVTGLVAAQLLYRAQRQTDLANARAEEIARLAEVARHADGLREAARVRDALLASVSHDMRTPLTTIRARAQDILADGDERAAVIAEEAMRLDRFVRDILDLSAITAGATRFDVQINAAEDLIGAALQRLDGVPGSKRIQARLDTSEMLLVGRFDFTQSLRILVNLMENALTYSPVDEVVELSASRMDGMLVFEVADRGPGVPDSLREQIFEPFVQGQSRSSTGLGLGLAIASALASGQGGRVDVRQRDGGGSVFRLELPGAELTDLLDDDAGEGRYTA